MWLEKEKEEEEHWERKWWVLAGGQRSHHVTFEAKVRMLAHTVREIEATRGLSKGMA